MRFPINHAYTDDQRITACEAIFPGDQPDPLQYWGIFMSYERSHHQSATEQYTSLRAAAFEWYTNRRIEGLIRVIADRMPEPEQTEPVVANPADFVVSLTRSKSPIKIKDVLTKSGTGSPEALDALTNFVRDDTPLPKSQRR